jgi:hypothetical protein
VTPVYDENGELINYICVQQKIRISKEREIRAERKNFKLLRKCLDEYSFFIFANAQTWDEDAENIFGYYTEAVLVMPMTRPPTEADSELGLPGRLLQQARIAGKMSGDGWRVRAE